MPSIRQITKWAARATSPADVPAIVHEAFYHLKTGRPRPVYLEVPHEVLAAEAEVKLLEPKSYAPPAGDPECIAQAAHLLAAAHRPVIWAGTGVQRSGASQALQALAEHLQAPVVTGRESKGVISDRHPLCLGMGELRFDPLREWLAQRDIVLAVGTSRFSEGNDKQQIIRIDIDETEIERTAHHLHWYFGGCTMLFGGDLSYRFSYNACASKLCKRGARYQRRAVRPRDTTPAPMGIHAGNPGDDS